MLTITHREVAFRDCQLCQAFMYDGEGKVVLWDGKPYPRGKHPTPCNTDVGCPKGSPDAGIALSPQNQQALRFHRRCEAVGRWPDDAMVAHNAVIISRAEAAADAEVQERESHAERRRRDRSPDS